MLSHIVAEFSGQGTLSQPFYLFSKLCKISNSEFSMIASPNGFNTILTQK